MRKKRKLVGVPNFPGIYKNLVFNDKNGKWEEPERGTKYKVARHAKGVDGKRGRKWEGFDSFAEAKSYRLNAAAEVAKPPTGKSGVSIMTLAKVTEFWRANSLVHKAVTTQIRYESYLQHFKYLEDQPVEDIRPITIDEWIAGLKEPNYLERFHSTRLNYAHEFSVLKTILTYYQERFNPEYRLPFLKSHRAMLIVKERAELKKDLAPEEFDRFMRELHRDVFGTKYELVFYIAGMQYAIYGRGQDAPALHYEDFDLEKGKLRVRRKVQWMRKKGMADLIVDGSKANGGKVLEMPAFAARLFKEWTMKTGIRSGPLFLYKGKPIPYRVLEYRYSKALRKAGLPFTATHILRHAALTEHYHTGKDLLSTAKVAGHSDLSSTQKYAKTRDEVLRDIQQRMDKKIGTFDND